MAEINNPNQDGDSSETPESFGEITEREVPSGEVAKGAEERSEEPKGNESVEDKPEEGRSDAEEKKEEYTEKGTKLDPNPQSRAHQELANERRIRTQMEQVLANPDLLVKFMKDQYGVNVPLSTDKTGDKTEEKGTDKPESLEYKEYKAEDLENLDDVAGVINGLQKNFAEKTKSYETKIQQMETAVNALLQNGRAQQIATTTSESVDYLRKQPELDPNSPEFIDGLEQDIAEEYHRLDYDEKTGLYKGAYTLKDIGDRMIAVARKATKKGSQRAQTIVKDKTEGKIVTSSKVSEDKGEEENSKPGDSIAVGVSKLFGR